MQLCARGLCHEYFLSPSSFVMDYRDFAYCWYVCASVLLSLPYGFCLGMYCYSSDFMPVLLKCSTLLTAFL